MLESIIFLLSIIHSIFGVGLLALGTPLLLILNYDFLTILKILLPCSIIISTFQIIKNKNILNKDKRLIYISLPFIFFGAIIIYFYSSQIKFKLVIGFSILIIFFLKTILPKKINLIVKKNKRMLFSLIGFFHGLTNTGGALISLLFQSLKRNKFEVRTCIAYTYFFYGLIQYCLLNFFFKEFLFDYNSVKLLIFTVIGYFFGNKIFKALKYNYFIIILNFIIITSAIYLIFSELK
jgi:uncharacterized membrane protein YfcA